LSYPDPPQFEDPEPYEGVEYALVASAVAVDSIILEDTIGGAVYMGAAAMDVISP
jgi:hypothetical protein